MPAPLSREERLIGQILGADWSRGARRRWPSSLFETIDWSSFVRLAERHQLRPMAAAAAREAGWPGAPAEVRARLEAGEKESVRDAMCQIAHLKEIFEGARTRGIRLLMLKGLGLGIRLHADPFIRQAGDLDLLVARADRAGLDSLLVELGYVEDERLAWSADSPRQTEILERFHHDKSFRHPVMGLSVERHWLLDHNRHRLETDFDSLWDTRAQVRVGACEVDILSGPALLPYVGHHAARHAWEKWKWIGDMAALLRQQGELVEEARAGVGPALFDSWILLVREVTGMVLPAGLLELARANRPARRLARTALWVGRARARGNEGRPSRLSSLVQAGYRLRLAGRAGAHFELASMLHDERDWRALRLPDRLIPLYYVLRPITFVLRRIMRLRHPPQR